MAKSVCLNNKDDLINLPKKDARVKYGNAEAAPTLDPRIQTAGRHESGL